MRKNRYSQGMFALVLNVSVKTVQSWEAGKRVPTHVAYRSPLLNVKISDDKTFLAQLGFDNPFITPKQAMIMLGFKRALEAAPLRELKTMIGKNKPHLWNHLINESTKMKLSTIHSPFKEIRKCIEEFKSIKNLLY